MSDTPCGFFLLKLLLAPAAKEAEPEGRSRVGMQFLSGCLVSDGVVGT